MKYLIELSNKREIPIDGDELLNVIEGIKTGSPVKVRQGIFNPSFFVAIVEDQERAPYQVYGEKEPKERPNLQDIFDKTGLIEKYNVKKLSR